MGVLRVTLLLATVAALFLAHRRVAPPVTVAIGAAVALVVGATTPRAAAAALRPLGNPLAFLVFAVPLAVLLDRVGFFDAAAERFSVGHRLRPSLWVFAAAVTTVLNLDAAVVLLTPLYLRVARRHGLDPLATAIQPVLLASLASSALPVSNLTNLIVAEQTGVGVGSFLVRLGPASLAAVVVGWLVFRRTVPPESAPDTSPVAIDPHALRLGAAAVGVLLVGFTVGDAFGIEPWVVAAVVTVALAIVVGELPVTSVPLGAIAVAAGLAVLAGAASPHLGLEAVLGGTGPGADARALLAGVIGADAINNLPALLVGLPHLDGGDALWAFLAGVNFGPVLWAGGSLAGLLWLDTMRRFGVPVGPGAYARLGVRVGLPALASAGVVVLATGWILG